MFDLFILSLFAFFAGLVDAVSGGGGLVQLPALLVTFPNAQLPLLLGTNKFASSLGTSVAAVRYGRRVALPWRLVLLSSSAAFVASFLGARLVSLVDPSFLRPVVVVVLCCVLVFTVARPSLGLHHAPKRGVLARHAIGMCVGGVIGFYDGFFGPGTGTFILFAFVTLVGFDFLHASACAKIINLATNLAALAYFIPTGNVRYDLAVLMALANMSGSFVGSHLALTHGTRFIRILFVVVVAGLLAKQTWLLAH
jgi:uncharacterized membrane protein YfcA